MWLETMVGKLAEVPARSTGQLSDLRARDRKSRDLVLLLNEGENKLFESLKAAQKEQGSEFDEAPFVAKAKELMQRRAELVVLLEEQGKRAQALYDGIDAKIEMFDRCTASVQHLVACEPGEVSKRKKRKRKAQAEGLEADAAVDPNEPVYCTCRMVSFGKMVGCENAECTVEWFHLACVGLSEDPPDRWHCPDCREKLGIVD